MIYLDALKNNPHAKVIINGLRGGTVSGYITQEFNFQGGARWNAPADHAKIQRINEIANTASRAFTFIPQAQVKSTAATLLSWEGGDYFQFNIPLIFVALEPSDDVREPVRKLVGASFPKLGAVISQPPNDYRRGIWEAKNAISVKIGKWFKTPLLFIIENVTYNFSKEVISSGLPLYVAVGIDFKSYMHLSYEKVQKFFSSGASGFGNPSGG